MAWLRYYSSSCTLIHSMVLLEFQYDEYCAFSFVVSVLDTVWNHISLFVLVCTWYPDLAE